MSSKSFIMLKPDAISNPETRAYIDQLLSEYELQKVDAFSTALSEEDILFFWSHQHLGDVINACLKCYLMGHKLEVILVEGNDAIAGVKKIKKQTRKKYSISMFSNCMHTPASEEEYLKQVKVFMDKQKHGYKIEDPRALSHNESMNIASSMFELGLSYGWDNVWKEINPISHSTNEYLLEIYNDDDHTLEEAAGIFFEQFDLWTIVKAYLCAIEIHRVGKVVVLGGMEQDLGKIKKINESLKARRINCSIIRNQTNSL
jgi:nucleoside diphosphate kinase